MKFIINVLVLLFFCGGVRASDADTAMFDKIMAAYFDGVASKDFVKLTAMTTSDFVLYEDGKVWTNDSVFHNIQYHEPFRVTFTLTDFRWVVGNELAYGSYRSHAEFVVEGDERFSLDFIEMAGFRMTGSGWKLSLLDITLLKTPEVGMPEYYRKYDTVRYIADHYADRMVTFKGEPARAGAVVFLGNSITEFGDWSGVLGIRAAVNRGIAGDNTFGMLDRLGEVIRHQPAKLFIEAGINDIGQGVPIGMIAGNIASMTQYVHVYSPKTTVFVFSVLPTNSDAKTDYPEIAGKNAVVDSLNRELAARAGTAGYTYVNIAPRLVDGSGQLDRKWARPDGLHLNKDGYGRVVGLLREKAYFQQ